MKKTMMNYEAPVAEMIEMQASMVLMASGEQPSQPSSGIPDFSSEGGGYGGGGEF